MGMSRWSVIGLVLISIVSSGVASDDNSPTTLSSSRRLRLRTIEQSLLNASQDLLDLAMASRSPERDSAFAMSDVAGDCAELFSVVGDLLYIHDGMVSAADRTLVRALLDERLRNYAKRVDLGLKYVNNHVALTDKPGIAAAGAGLRDTLRDGAHLLEALGK